LAIARTSSPTNARRAAPVTSTVATPARTAVEPNSARPFVSGIVDCDGTSVRGNLINVDPSPEHVTLGMKVRLATYSLGIDDQGTEAIGFGFEPTQ